LKIAEAVFRRIDDRITFSPVVQDGYRASTGDKIVSIEGSTRALLAAERTALNFLQRLSGIATLTHSIVESISPAECRVVDTRKTTPGWRVLGKYAVRIGGGRNHRFSLGDGILIKENHIHAAGGIEQALERALANKRHPLIVQIEVRTSDEAARAVRAGAEALLLDNMSPSEVRNIAKLYRSRVLLETSGNITPETIREYALTGVHLISVGRLTHSAPAADLSMLFV